MCQLFVIKHTRLRWSAALTGVILAWVPDLGLGLDDANDACFAHLPRSKVHAAIVHDYKKPGKTELV